MITNIHLSPIISIAEVGPKVFREYLNSSEFKEIELNCFIRETFDIPKNTEISNAHELQTLKIN